VKRPLEPGQVAAFLGAVLEREGALAEAQPDGGLAAMLAPDLQARTGLPEAATLRVLGAAGPGELPLPLESRAVQWCLDAACGRGRQSSVRLPGVRPRASGVADAVRSRFSAGNCALRGAVTREHALGVLVLEFRYQALGEERAEGSVYLAYEPWLRIVSAPLAGALLQELPGAEPAAFRCELATVEAAAAAAAPHARTLVRAGLEGLRTSLAARMARDAQRLVAYHETMLREHGRRGRARADAGRAGAEAALADADARAEAKAAAITRRRDEKLRELTFRYGVTVRWSLASVLEVGYPVSACELVLLRRRREIPVVLAWDPFLHDVAPIACQGCGEPGLAFQACDEAGHLTCRACCAPCRRCRKAACRGCHPGGCPGCAAGR
jgi:hypothetical protein